MSFFNRPPLAPRQPGLPPWSQTDDFADFEARVDRDGPWDDLVQRSTVDPQQATRDMFMRDRDRRTIEALPMAAEPKNPRESEVTAKFQLAQAARSPDQAAKTGSGDRIGQFQQYVKERFRLSDAEAAELMAHGKKWMATPWNAPDSVAIMGMVGNADGLVSPRQDHAIRKMIESVPREGLRDRARSGYGSTFQDGSLRVVDDPRKK